MPEELSARPELGASGLGFKFRLTTGQLWPKMLRTSHVGSGTLRIWHTSDLATSDMICEFWSLRALRARGGGAHPLGEKVRSTATASRSYGIPARKLVIFDLCRRPCCCGLVRLFAFWSGDRGVCRWSWLVGLVRLVRREGDGGVGKFSIAGVVGDPNNGAVFGVDQQVSQV